ncbi:hypothetical protein Q8F55_006190 [Vanrija albida]|uniref:Uncharacterized protein n=1 Tax=Vanrija albida TaxID=181172 RepID=A0ABR3PWD3_9TREE
MFAWIKQALESRISAWGHADKDNDDRFPEIAIPNPHQILVCADGDVGLEHQTVYLADPKRRVSGDDKAALIIQWYRWSIKHDVPATFDWAHRRGCDAFVILMEPGFTLDRDQFNLVFDRTERYLKLKRSVLKRPSGMEHTLMPNSLDVLTGSIVTSTLYPQYGRHVVFNQISLNMKDAVLLELRVQLPKRDSLEHAVKWELGGCRASPPCSLHHRRTVSDSFKYYNIIGRPFTDVERVAIRMGVRAYCRENDIDAVITFDAVNDSNNIVSLTVRCTDLADSDIEKIVATVFRFTGEVVIPHTRAGLYYALVPAEPATPDAGPDDGMIPPCE